MKKLLILPLLLLIVGLSSCTKSDNESYFGYIVVTSIESTNHDTGVRSVSDFGYVQYDANFNPIPIVNGTVMSIPILSRQTITNDKVSEIKYTYLEQMKYLAVEIKSTDGDLQEKYKLNDLLMAESKLVGETYVTLDNIRYDAKGFRTLYNGLSLFSESSEYTRVEKDGNVVATYDYTMFINPMGLQQLNIPGEKYLNVCDNFGKQSRHLLSRATIQENDAPVVYEYKYSFDPYGYIHEEFITRDGKPYITRRYSYASVTVVNNTDAK